MLLALAALSLIRSRKDWRSKLAEAEADEKASRESLSLLNQATSNDKDCLANRSPTPQNALISACVRGSIPSDDSDCPSVDAGAAATPVSIFRSLSARSVDAEPAETRLRSSLLGRAVLLVARCRDRASALLVFRGQGSAQA